MKPVLILLSVSFSLLLAGCESAPTYSEVVPEGSPPLYRQMTDKDVTHANAALQYSLESLSSSEKQSWHNQRSGNSGEITPLRTYKSVSGYYCREYQELIHIGTLKQVYQDTACRSEDGTWYPI